MLVSLGPVDFRAFFLLASIFANEVSAILRKSFLRDHASQPVLLPFPLDPVFNFFPPESKLVRNPEAGDCPFPGPPPDRLPVEAEVLGQLLDGPII